MDIDDLNMQDMLREVAGGGVHYAKSKAPVEKPPAVETEKTAPEKAAPESNNKPAQEPKTVVGTIPKKEAKQEASNPPQVKKTPPQSTRRKRRKRPSPDTPLPRVVDPAFTTTAIRRKHLQFLKLVYPDQYVRDSLDLVLQAWTEQNKDKIMALTIERLKD